MGDLDKKKLRAWLEKSLANHPENDNDLVAYVEAIVGDAEGSVRATPYYFVFATPAYRIGGVEVFVDVGRSDASWG